jgi:prolyl oligopeptidase
MAKLQYPHTKKVDHTDEYHGTFVVDSYRWLEDTDSSDTASWIESQNELTQSFLH